jgi:hypothetical protein
MSGLCSAAPLVEGEIVQAPHASWGCIVRTCRAAVPNAVVAVSMAARHDYCWLAWLACRDVVGLMILIIVKAEPLASVVCQH